MKTKFQLAAVLVIAALATLFAQGPLTPPGAPAPTMKTLQQVEPRTPITSVPATISESGSYYLTANAVVGDTGAAITIAADHVTLDLNGFSIVTPVTNGTGTAILLSGGRRNIAISNGHIVGDPFSTNGFLHGINWSKSAPQNVRVTDLSVSGCGMHGIQLGDDYSTMVERCTVGAVGAEGIRAGVVSRSTAVQCGGIAMIGQTASHCYGQSTASYGLYVQTAENCAGESASGIGIYAITAQNCSGTSSSSTGLSAFTATNCFGRSFSGYGISTANAMNCYGESRGYAGIGLYAGTLAQNCIGRGTPGSLTVRGVYALIAQNCFGYSPEGGGLEAVIASFCVGGSDTGENIIGQQYFCGGGPLVYP